MPMMGLCKLGGSFLVADFGLGVLICLTKSLILGFECENWYSSVVFPLLAFMIYCAVK